jgi:hypothetical protein
MDSNAFTCKVHLFCFWVVCYLQYMQHIIQSNVCNYWLILFWKQLNLHGLCITPPNLRQFVCNPLSSALCAVLQNNQSRQRQKPLNANCAAINNCCFYAFSYPLKHWNLFRLSCVRSGLHHVHLKLWSPRSVYAFKLSLNSLAVRLTVSQPLPKR